MGILILMCLLCVSSAKGMTKAGGLTYGDKGDEVLSLQTALSTLGYKVGKIDGSYGAYTENAVRKFQKDHRLSVDGIAGVKTRQLIYDLVQGKTAATQVPAATPVPAAAPAAQPVQVQTQTRADGSFFGGNYSTIYPGTTGTRVVLLQSALNQLGYPCGKADGKYGSGTQTAVKNFQKAQKLTADGVAGKNTLRKMESLRSSGTAAQSTAAQSAVVPIPVQTAAAYRNLNLGSTGADVTALQNALKNLSYSLSVTGTYDSTTKTAVRAFQKQNGLTADGVAGRLTQAKLYAGNAVPASSGTTVTPVEASPVVSYSGGPSKSEIRLLHWFKDIKPAVRSGQTILVYDPATGISWNLRLYSLGRHADSEPLTADDTAKMVKSFGNTNTWNQKAVYVRLPSGVWTVGSTHDMPHLSGSIKDNNFNGHLCVHFLRDMSECEQNDPSYGVANQKTIRSAWKALTGEELTY